jgi:glycosyltransferase involved in cell wall biosynthesis
MYPCSLQAASVVAGKGYRGLLTPLPLGIPDGTFAPVDKPLSQHSVRIGLVGRMVAEKGPADAVAVVRALGGGQRVTLVLVGDGPELETTITNARSAGVAVEHHAWCDQTELAELYRSMHVLLAPSRATATWVEQFGRMLVEAQASGAVVVGYASGAIPWVGGEAAIVVPEGDVRALTAAVAGLLRDPSRYARLRQTGLARAPDFHWDEVARRQVQFYQAAIDHPVPPPPARPSPSVRAAARSVWGEPARLAGGEERPFALPLLRNPTPVSRALGRAFDALEALRTG